MPIEKTPTRPLPVDFRPVGGTPYRVQDGDNWKSVAANNGLDPGALVFFNFLTRNPDEVNWYLHRNVGCNKPTRNGNNWTFSSSAKPGIIYLYPRRIDIEPEVVPGKGPGRTKLARFLDDFDQEEFELGKADEIADFVIDIPEIVHTAVDVATTVASIAGSESWEAFEDVGTDIGMGLLPIAWAAKVWTELGKANYEPVLAKRRFWYTLGLAEGIVLGANDAKRKFVRWYFWKEKGSIYDSVYPEQGHSYENYHNLGLGQGYSYGKQLNLPEKGAFFRELNARMHFNAEDFFEMSEDARVRYYQDAAEAFREAHLPK